MLGEGWTGGGVRGGGVKGEGVRGRVDRCVKGGYEGSCVTGV